MSRKLLKTIVDSTTRALPRRCLLPDRVPSYSSRLCCYFSDLTTTNCEPPSAFFRVHNTLEAGLIDYRRSWAWQHLLLSRRLSARRQQKQEKQDQNFETAPMDDHDLVLLFEHEPVYTLGRGADENYLTFLDHDMSPSAAGNDEITTSSTPQAPDPRRLALSRKNRGGARLAVDRALRDDSLLILPNEMAVEQLIAQASPVYAPNGAPIYRVERGGEVTFHGPGQLVVYPLMDLKRPPFVSDLHWFLRQMEEVILQTLYEYDIQGVRDQINTGVWVDSYKIAAVGVAASRWITTHGFALNVNPDLSYFDTSIILPCGIEERGVTSLANILRDRGATDTPTVAQVADVVLQKIEKVFGVSALREEPSCTPNGKTQ